MAFLARVTAFTLLLVLTAGTACAQSSTVAARSTQASVPTRPPTFEPTEYKDYRPTLAASDAIGLGLMVASVPLDDGRVALGGFGVYALGAPIIHLANGEVGRGAGSFGMRLVSPFAGAIIGGAVATVGECNRGGLDCFGEFADGVALGALGGSVLAAVIDDVFLGKVPIEKAPPPTALSVLRRTATLAPYFDREREALGLTLAGSF